MSFSPLFTGCATALVTPFRTDGTIDEPALSNLINIQLKSGVDAIVLLGTTGEPCTLTMNERERILTIGTETIAGRVPLIAGTGANSTQQAIEYAKQARSLGADGQLCVTPYYNKATQSGLVRHFTAIAESSDLPLILYNVPSRTGMSISAEAAAELALHPKVAGIKEASGSLSLAADILTSTKGSLPVYSGNDDIIVPMMALGSSGVISVCSNVAPDLIRRITQSCLLSQYDSAREMQLKLLPLIRALFTQINPIPVKAALSMMGLCRDSLRLPLTQLEEPHRAKLHGVLRSMQLV